MSKLSIKEVLMKGFRSFSDLNSSGLLPDGGLIAIQGKNLDTGGSNGSGKSNFHLAISYALGYCPYPATELQSSTSDNEIQVILLLDLDGKEILLKRGKEETSIEFDGIKHVGASVVAEELKKIIPIDSKMLEALTFRRQRSTGRFLSLTDSKKKEFLSTLLGLGKLEDSIEENRKLATDSSEHKFELLIQKQTTEKMIKEPVAPEQFDLDSIKAKLLPVEEQETFLIKKKSEIHPILVEAGKAIKGVMLEEFVFISEETPNFYEVKRQIVEVVESIDKERKKIEKQKLLIQEDREKLVDYVTKNKGVTNKIARLEVAKLDLLRKIDGIKQSICVACNRDWIPDETILKALEIELEENTKITTSQQRLESRVEESRQEIEALDKKLLLLSTDKINQLLAKESMLKNELQSMSDALNLQKETARKSFEKNKKEQISKIESKNSELAKEYEKCNKLLQELEKERIKIQSELKYSEKFNKDKTQTYELALRKYSEQQENIQSLVNKIEKAHNKTVLHENTVNCLKGFLNKIFEEVLNEIGEETNIMLARVANVNNLTVNFVTERLTQSNEVKEEIRPVIYKSGREITSKSGLSGGQFASVEWATDLAINTVICRRTGFNPAWIILDEPFDNHDDVTKISCLELLKENASDRIIFLIDHTSGINDVFDKSIKIEYTGDVSKIVEEFNQQ